MGNFRYEAVDSGGRTVRGTLNALDRLAAARALREQGLVPTQVSTSAPSGLARQVGRAFRGHRTVLRFTEDLATLLDAGVALERALSIAADTADNEDESALAGQILGSVRGGESLADALALQPEYFSRLYVNSVRTGEVAGELPLVMAELASFERGRERLRSEILTALAYPVLLLIVGATSILVILMYVVPKFATSFSYCFQQSRQVGYGHGLSASPDACGSTPWCCGCRCSVCHSGGRRPPGSLAPCPHC